MNELVGTAQTLAAPLVLVGFLMLAMTAARIGRRVAGLLLLGLVAFPWLVGAAAYYYASHDAEQAMRAIASTDVTAFREQIAQELHSLWLAPQGLSVVGAVTFGIVLLRTRRR